MVFVLGGDHKRRMGGVCVSSAELKNRKVQNSIGKEHRMKANP